MKRKPIPFLVKTILIATFLLSLNPANGKQKSEIVFEKFDKPWIFNSQFLNVNGEATIDAAFLFNEEGWVDDWITIRTNDKRLISSLAAVVDGWKIVPPVVDGEARWCYIELKIIYRADGAVISLSPSEALMSLTGSMRDDFQLLVPFAELDSIPKPIKMDTPALTPKLMENSSGETVKFEFFIDQEGKVRLPVVKEEYNAKDVAAAIMLESLLKWEFEPPMKNGKPVLTRAVIPFKIP